MAETTQTPAEPQLTPSEIAARSALIAADEALRHAQEFVTKALAPCAAMEAERHPSGPLIARTISEARMNVSCAQRQVKTLMEYTLPRPNFIPPGVNGPVEDQRANVGESLSRVCHLATDGARFA